ncbi:hypothetical protein G6L37_05500 [Agrobacterium rubi]|nr:hypothetical protein [Agrobacterium rubi]NTF24813.1 hypothetical protein [Agrobacterium rubi]
MLEAEETGALAPYTLTGHDVFYLGSISRSIGDIDVPAVGDQVSAEYLEVLRCALPRLEAARNLVEGPSLACEVVSDNHEWLDCFIEMLGSRESRR